MAGKLVFKLTGGKSDKDEEYEALKDEFLKYKKVCAPPSAPSVSNARSPARV